MREERRPSAIAVKRHCSFNAVAIKTRLRPSAIAVETIRLQPLAQPLGHREPALRMTSFSSQRRLPQQTP